MRALPRWNLVKRLITEIEDSSKSAEEPLKVALHATGLLRDIFTDVLEANEVKMSTYPTWAAHIGSIDDLIAALSLMRPMYAKVTMIGLNLFLLFMSAAGFKGEKIPPDLNEMLHSLEKD